MECGKFEKYIKLAMLECADRDSELFCTIDTSGVVVLPRLEKRILKLIRQRTKSGGNRFKYKRRRAYKLVGVIAAVLMILYLSLSVYASTKGMSGVEFIRMHADKILNMVVGDSVEGDGITLIKNGDKKKYKTIEDAVNEGNLSIMCPSLLPEDAKIIQVEQLFIDGSDKYLIMLKTNAEIYMTVKNYSITDPKMFEDHEIYEVNGITFYLTSKDSLYIATCQQDGLEYYVQCDNRDDLMLIIENMKKVS